MITLPSLLRRRPIWVVLPVLALLAAGCPIDDGTCEEHVSVGSASVLIGEAGWSTDGVFDASNVASAEHAEAPCRVSVALGSGDGQGNGALDSIYPFFPLVDSWISLDCFEPYDHPGLPADRWFRATCFFGDFRDWPLGEVAPADLEPPTGDAVGAIWSHEACTDPLVSDTCLLCSTETPWPLVRVTVLEATGGSAPYPDVVTDDFLRRLRIELDTGAPLAGETNDGVTCEVTRSATALVEVSIGADAFTFQACD